MVLQLPEAVRFLPVTLDMCVRAEAAFSVQGVDEFVAYSGKDERIRGFSLRGHSTEKVHSCHEL